MKRDRGREIKIIGEMDADVLLISRRASGTWACKKSDWIRRTERERETSSIGDGMTPDTFPPSRRRNYLPISEEGASRRNLWRPRVRGCGPGDELA